MTGSFHIKTPSFEGPLELLLDLIEKRKLLISDIALASVTDEYIAYVEKLEEFPVAQTAQFIVVASTLLLIKSKSLLPVLELSEEEHGDIADLERRLKLYQKFRKLGAELDKYFGTQELRAAEKNSLRDTPLFSPSNDIAIPSLLLSVQTVLRNLPKKIFVPEAIIEKVVSLEEMIDRLASRIQSALSLSFKEFTGMGRGKKADVIIGFLAMLELVKRGSLTVVQQAHFGDIRIESGGVSTPRYGEY